MHINKHFKKDFIIISALLIAVLSGLLGFYLGFSNSLKPFNKLPISKSITDHISIGVKNFDESVKFYDATLSTLGYERIMTFGKNAAGYGKDKKPSFWLVTNGKEDDYYGKAHGLHIAFAASSMENIQAWYDACLAHGATSNGPPGQRKQYHPGYYAAFIIDPDGWHIEAVLHNYKPDKSI